MSGRHIGLAAWMNGAERFFSLPGRRRSLPASVASSGGSGGKGVRALADEWVVMAAWTTADFHQHGDASMIIQLAPAAAQQNERCSTCIRPKWPAHERYSQAQRATGTGRNAAGLLVQQ